MKDEGCIGILFSLFPVPCSLFFSTPPLLHSSTIPRSLAYLLRGFQRPAAPEDGQAAKQALLRRGEQVVAPVQHAAQRLLMRRRVPITVRQQVEPIGDARQDLLDRQGVDAR